MERLFYKFPCEMTRELDPTSALEQPRCLTKKVILSNKNIFENSILYHSSFRVKTPVFQEIVFSPPSDFISFQRKEDFVDEIQEPFFRKII